MALPMGAREAPYVAALPVSAWPPHSQSHQPPLGRAILVDTSFGLSVVILREQASYQGDLPALEDGRERLREATAWPVPFLWGSWHIEK